jgi:glycosyltransferase involved in cell wall biosynthesis
MARAVSGLCRALAARGHEVTVVTARLDAAHPPEESLHGVRVLRLDVPRVLQRLLVPWGPGLSDLLARAGERFDVAHLHGHRSGLTLQGASILGRARVPWVLQPHGTYPHHGRHRLAKGLLDALVAERVVRAAGAVLAVSEAEARDLPRRSRVVPNGVDEPQAGPTAERRAGALLFVGSDHPQKRADRLAAILEALPEASLVLVGRFRRGAISQLGAERGRVTLRGVLDPAALARAYREASLIVHPAEAEAFGLVPFEAALLGTPAVVVAGHGCGEWFGRAGGCVVPYGDSTPFVAAVRERLAERARGEAEARAVARFCRGALTWDRAAASVEGLYRDLIAERRPEPPARSR